MGDFYYRVFDRLPIWLKRRVNPVEYAIRDFVESAASGPPGLVLDAGAGQSRFQEYFSHWRYVALDRGIGDPAWDYSKLDVIGDLGQLPIAPSVADLVLNTQVLEHVRNPGLVLSEFARILKPGGSLYLTAPQGWPEHQQPHDYFRFTRYALAVLLEESGFSEWEIQRIGGYFHYLGHRLTYIPKILFWRSSGVIRWVLLPLELLSLGLFCFLAPLACSFLDRLDRTGEFALCYRVRAVRK